MRADGLLQEGLRGRCSALCCFPGILRAGLDLSLEVLYTRHGFLGTDSTLLDSNQAGVVLCAPLGKDLQCLVNLYGGLPLS